MHRGSNPAGACAGEIQEGQAVVHALQVRGTPDVVEWRSFSLWLRACAAPSERVRFSSLRNCKRRVEVLHVVVHLEEA